MIELYADKASLTVRRREVVTSGAMGVFCVDFQFSRDWDGLEKVAVFRAGDRSVSVVLDTTEVCAIPWEALTLSNRRLMAGVYGAKNGTLVLPTVWADCGTILEGAKPCETARPPTPGVFEQFLSHLAGKQDKLTGQPGQVVGFDKNGNAVVSDAASHFEVVDAVPTAETAQDGVLYLVKKESANTYDIYVKAGNQVVKTGDTDIDLSGYVQKEDGKGLSANDYTDEDKAKMDGIALATDAEVDAMLDEIFAATNA